VIRLQEAQLRENDYVNSIQGLKQRLAIRDMECDEVSKSYFGFKHTVEESKQRIKDDRELLLIEKRVLEDQLDQLKERSFNDKEYSVDMYQKKTDSFAQRFRKLTQKNEHELKVVKIQYEQFQEQYRSDIAEFN